MRFSSSGLESVISICEALCYSPHLHLTAASPPNDSVHVYMSAAVCLAQHKQGVMRTEGSTKNTKYVCTTWMIERSPSASCCRRIDACTQSVFACSVYLRSHKHGVSVMRCSLHPSALLAFTSSQGDNRAELKREWRERQKEGDKQSSEEISFEKKKSGSPAVRGGKWQSLRLVGAPLLF